MELVNIFNFIAGQEAYENKYSIRLFIYYMRRGTQHIYLFGLLFLLIAFSIICQAFYAMVNLRNIEHYFISR